MPGRINLGYDYDLGDERDTKTARIRERRVFRREVDIWRYPPPPGQVEALLDTSDCEHGCAGGCDRAGSDVCTFVCHPESLAVRVEQCLERVGPCTPDGEPDGAPIRAYLDDWERQHRLQRGLR